MPARCRWLVAPVLTLVVLVAPREVLAQGSTTSGLRVLARVAPLCTVMTSPLLDATTNAELRVVCGRSALRALRVSTNAGRDEDLKPLAGFAGPQRLAGGEVLFSLPDVLGTLASQRPVALPRAIGPAAVVVTLDF